MLLLYQTTSSGNVLQPIQDSSIQHPLTLTTHIPMTSASHNSAATGSPNPLTLPSNNTPCSDSQVHATTSSSQPVTSIHHRSLRRILSQDQQITTSPRKLRKRGKPFLHVSWCLPFISPPPTLFKSNVTLIQCLKMGLWINSKAYHHLYVFYYVFYDCCLYTSNP